MEFRKNQTIYLQIADYICENIMAEQWIKGDKIQSVREMAATIQVNPNTVMRTYSHLQDFYTCYKGMPKFFIHHKNVILINPGKVFILSGITIDPTSQFLYFK